MDIKLFTVKAITLLYQESLLDDKRESTSKPIIRKAMDYIKVPEAAADEGIERNTIMQLRSTLLWMLSNTDSQPYDKNDLLQRLRINAGKDDKLYDAFLQSICDYPNRDVLVRSVNRGLTDLRKYINQEKVKETLRKASHSAAFKASEIQDWNHFLQLTIGELGSIDMGGDVKQDPAFVSTVNFKLADSVRNAFTELEDVMSDEGTIKAPWHAANRMTGEVGAFRRGEFWNWCALPHNYKSGWLMDLFVGGCIFNDPFAFDKTKKPAIILFSTEDDTPIIIQKIYVILKQIETGMPIKVKQIDKDEATRYVMEKLTARGWDVFIHRVRPSMFTYFKYVQTLENYKADGYEIAMVVCDYLAMFNREGCNNASTGDDIQDMFRRVREYTTANRILHHTAHQLSTQAKDEKRMDEKNFLMKLPGKGFYQSCKKLDDEVDGEGYLNKQITSAGAWLEVLWGKHRKVGATPEKDKYFVLKFLEPPLYGIAYDILAEDSSYRQIGGRNGAGGGEFMDMDF